MFTFSPEWMVQQYTVRCPPDSAGSYLYTHVLRVFVGGIIVSYRMSGFFRRLPGGFRSLVS